MRHCTTIRYLLATVSILSALGCGVQVNRLDDGHPSSMPRYSESFPFSLRVDRLVQGDGDTDKYWPNLDLELSDAIRASRLFSYVGLSDSISGETDFILRGTIETRWGEGGFANFATYFPGGLIFAPSWRGTRWDFHPTLNMELIDNRSGEVVGRYLIEAAYESVHRSGNPMHFFGAALVIPATITGSGKAWVRSDTRERVYKVAYPELVQEIAMQLYVDRAPAFRAENAERADRCGDRHGAVPTVGKSWEQFRSCQPNHFTDKGELATDAGTARIFDDTAGLWRVFVVDGFISEWEEQSASKANCGAFYGAAPRIGDSWGRFRRCHPKHFSQTSEQATDVGKTLVFEDTAATWRIYVVEDSIRRWEIEAPSVSANAP